MTTVRPWTVLLADELVVLQQTVIGPLREEQRREVERVDQREWAVAVGPKVAGVVVDDVMPAQEFHLAQEAGQLSQRTAMVHGSIISQSSDIMDLVVADAYLDIYYGIPASHWHVQR